MRSAPSVIYPVLRSRRAGAMLAILWCLGALPVTAWLMQVSVPAAASAAVLGWTTFVGLLCAWRWWRFEPDYLAWDGQSWSTKTAFDARVAVTLDLQFLMVLRVMPPVGRSQWLMVDRDASPRAWHSLRCAVAASGPERAA